ncbi:MAG TPA: hypothetical protein VFX50_10530 [Gemmatimonadales bacterium]|nr:hypothetical protein [Gemmatimonadales bacterium]
MIPLLVGAVLALAALAWVMEPLFARRDPRLAGVGGPEPAHDDDDVRELALDVASGRLSRAEFERLTAAPLPPNARSSPGA